RRFCGITDKMQGVRYARILRDGSIVEIDTIGTGMKNRVLYQCTGTNGAEYFRLFLFGKVDGFGIAATFEIEDAVLCPAMFIIANQFAAWVGAEGSFTCTTQSKEYGGIAIFAAVGTTMHAQYIALLGQNIIQDGENAFFHFTCIT